MHGERRGRPVAAGFGRRLVAFVLDAVVTLAIGAIALTLLSLAVGPSAAVDLDATGGATSVDVAAPRAVVNALVVAVASGAYFVLSWHRDGRTPGQRAVGIRVVPVGDRPDADGRRLSLARAAVRWALLGAPLGIAAAATLDAPLAFAAVSVASFAWMLALILSTLATPRGIHDRISRSAVVREPPGRR